MTRAVEAAIHLCRANDIRAGTAPVGARLLIDWLWPRGIAKDDLPIDAGPENVTMRLSLRKWFGFGHVRRVDFGSRYLHELRAVPEAEDVGLDWCRKGAMTLIYAAIHTQHIHALVLRNHFAARLAMDPSQ